MADSAGSYFTDTTWWVCSCPFFVGSCFLLCKHLVRRVVNLPSGDRRKLIKSNFECCTMPPFLVIKDFINEDVMNSTLSASSTTSVEVFETHNVDNIFNDNDLKNQDDACTFVESNWPLFEQAFKQVRTEKLANNWNYVRAVIKSSKLLQIEEEVQAVERKKKRQTTWAPENKKPYLMYLSFPDESSNRDDKPE
ncbi:7922_t:CDS:1 [Cetraspora pellucida]|uniref:7922_t:CDS:1 n=1 Tax=Cetraspora pellucida TaxID=1433469 RepID=A0ACA9K3M7_9GLOM|nr:7922_t:CDS:1 [Cetraspora pellucida]